LITAVVCPQQQKKGFKKKIKRVSEKKKKNSVIRKNMVWTARKRKPTQSKRG